MIHCSSGGLLAEHRLARSHLALVDAQLVAPARMLIQSPGAPDHVLTRVLHRRDNPFSVREQRRTLGDELNQVFGEVGAEGRAGHEPSVEDGAGPEVLDEIDVEIVGQVTALDSAA
jgi:hypothetical protein